ncbi:MAG TPA: response regulator transcription factor [Ardenticatenaceae bacterium]|jgi:DNA-binding NarL/FixJ family response regulator
MVAPIRVLLVDDYPLFKEGVRVALAETPDIRFIGFADHAGDAARLCERLAPDVLLYCSRPTEGLSLDLLDSLHQQFPAMKILLMVDEAQREQAMATFQRSVQALLYKRDPLPLLERAIRAICAGGMWLSPSISRSSAKAPDPALLTEREAEVLELIARGWDNTAVAASLFLGEQTVRNYTSRVYQKLEVSSRGEAIVWALEHGLGQTQASA